MVQVPTSLWDTGPDTGLGVAGMQRVVFAKQRLFNIYMLTVAPSSHASPLPSNPTRIRFVSPASGTTAESPAMTSQKPACRLLTIALPFLKMGNAKWLCKPFILEVEARSNWSRKVPHGRQHHERFNELLPDYEHEAFKPKEKPVDQNQADQEHHRESF